VVRYSEAFKVRLMEDVASGKYQSLEEARRRNGIRGCATLAKWLKRYGREDMLPKRIKVETMEEIDELQTARSRIRELEAALADAHMDYCLESAFLEIACEKLGTTAEELKKRTSPRLPKGERNGGRLEAQDEHRGVKPEAGDEPAKLLQRAETAAEEGGGGRGDRTAGPRRAGVAAASGREKAVSHAQA
jgi:transposase-like protein